MVVMAAPFLLGRGPYGHPMRVASIAIIRRSPTATVAVRTAPRFLACRPTQFQVTVPRVAIIWQRHDAAAMSVMAAPRLLGC